MRARSLRVPWGCGRVTEASLLGRVLISRRSWLPGRQDRQPAVVVEDRGGTVLVAARQSAQRKPLARESGTSWGLVGEGEEITRLVGEGHQEVLHWTYKFERQAYHCVRAGRHASTQARAHASKHAGKREPAQAIMQAWHQAIKHTSAHARRRSITRSRNHPRTQARTRLLYHHRRSLGVRSVYLQHEQCHP